MLRRYRCAGHKGNNRQLRSCSVYYSSAAAFEQWGPDERERAGAHAHHPTPSRSHVTHQRFCRSSISARGLFPCGQAGHLACVRPPTGGHQPHQVGAPLSLYPQTRQRRTRHPSYPICPCRQSGHLLPGRWWDRAAPRRLALGEGPGGWIGCPLLRADRAADRIVSFSIAHGPRGQVLRLPHARQGGILPVGASDATLRGGLPETARRRCACKA